MSSGDKFLQKLVAKQKKSPNEKLVVLWYALCEHNIRKIAGFIEIDENNLNHSLKYFIAGLYSKDSDIVRAAIKLFISLTIELSGLKLIGLLYSKFI